MNHHRLFATAAVALGLLSPIALVAQSDSTGPSALRYKGVRLTPVAYFAAEALYRQRNISADMGSSYNAIPFSNTTAGQMSEFRASARQSRLGLLAEGKLDSVALSGYFEGDFLSAGVTSNSNESNSYTFRIRQFWGQAAFSSGLSFAGGQMWSLLTTNKSGVSPRSELTPATIEAQYVPGFNWARQAALRLSQKVADGMWLAVAVEEPQMTFAARGAPTNFVIGQAGGSQLNSSNYSTDLAPDVIAKLAIEPGFGHWEIKAVGRAFRNRIVDPTNVSGGSRNDNQFAGGVGIGTFFQFEKMVDLGISGLYGRGIGRYGTSTLPDATVNADGTLSPIRAAHGLVTLDIHATPKLDVYLYGGAEYEYRDASVNSTGKGVGYGSPLLSNVGCDAEYAPTGPYAPGSAPSATPCNADTRMISQGTAGFWYRFYKGPAGTFQWGMQGSYTNRSTWDGAGTHPQANEIMVFNSFRYYVP